MKNKEIEHLPRSNCNRHLNRRMLPILIQIDYSPFCMRSDTSNHHLLFLVVFIGSQLECDDFFAVTIVFYYTEVKRNGLQFGAGLLCQGQIRIHLSNGLISFFC